jgi:hypothetical protein
LIKELAMISQKEAIDLAIDRINIDFNLSENGDCVKIITEKTLILKTGWVFFYNSSKFLDSGDGEFMLLGNKPIFVEMSTGDIMYIRMDIPISDQLT